MAGPLVRSSYRAGRLWATAMTKWGRPIPEHLRTSPTPPVTRRARKPRRRPPARRPRWVHPPDTRILTPMARDTKPESDTRQEAGPVLPDPSGVHGGARPYPTSAGGCARLLAVLAVGTPSAVLVGHWTYALVLSIPLGAARRHARAQPSGRARGVRQPRGPARCGRCRALCHCVVAGSSPRSRWPSTVPWPPDMTSAFVYRAIGRPGVVLVAEGPERSDQAHRPERKKVERVAPGVPISRSRR